MLPRRGIAALAILGLSATWLVLHATRLGPGYYSDADIFVESARHFIDGHGLTMEQPNGTYRTDAFFPPGYALLLASGSLWKMDPLAWARWLNALFFGGLVLLVGVAVVQAGGRKRAGLLAAVVTASSLDLLNVHAIVLSDPAFLCIGLASFLFLGAYWKRPRKALLVSAAMFMGVAWMIRYAAIAWIAAGSLGLLFLGSQTRGARARSAALFGLISVLPMIPWAWSTRSPGNIFDRNFSFHPAALLSRGTVAPETVYGWIFQDAPVQQGLACLALVGAAAWVVYQFLRSREPLVRLAALAIGLYLGLLIATIIGFDATTSFEPRLLAPVHVLVIVLLFSRLARRWDLAFCMVAALFVWRGAVWAHLASREGIGFSSQEWRQSGLLARIKALDPAMKIYTNVPYPILVGLNRHAFLLPPPVDVNTGIADAHYDQSLRALARRLGEGQAVIAYFNHTEGDEDGAPPLDVLRRSLPLKVITQAEDGEIYTQQTAADQKIGQRGAAIQRIGHP